SRAEFKPLSAAEWGRRGEMRTLEGQIYRQTQRIILENADEIRRRFPRILRRVSGYNLDLVSRAFADDPSRAIAGLNDLVVGSEGTLAVIESMELRIVSRPKFRGLIVAHFTSLSSAMEAIACCLESRPSAVELLDHWLLELARSNLALKDTMAAI